MNVKCKCKRMKNMVEANKSKKKIYNESLYTQSDH